MFDSNSTPDLIAGFVLGLVTIALAVTGIVFGRLAQWADGRHWFRAERSWSVAFFSAAVLTLMGTSGLLFASVNAVQATGVSLQAQLDAQFMQDQNVLSTYVNGFYEMLGVANLQSSQIDKILVGAVGSQVDLQTWAQDPKASPLYSALFEAYPNVTLSQYQQVIAYIQQGRQSFQSAQNTLLSELGQYDQWRETGVIFHPLEVSFFGFPNSQLHATVGDTTYYGAAAEAKMWNIVRNPAAELAFSSGVQSPLSSK